MSNTSASSPILTEKAAAEAWEEAERQQLRRFRALPLREKILAIEAQGRVARQLLERAQKRRAEARKT